MTVIGLGKIDPGGSVVFCREFGQTPQFSPAFCDAMNEIDPRVHDDHHLCEWVSPYGFVPEAGCPLHD